MFMYINDIHNKITFRTENTLLLPCVSRVTVKKLTVDMSLLLKTFSFSVCATKNPNEYLNTNIKFKQRMH